MTPPRLTRDMRSEINRTAYRATQLAYAELRKQMQAAALQAIAEGRDWDECQKALLTLQRLRNGGNQQILVQHVNVSQGGQALVGNVQVGERT